MESIIEQQRRYHEERERLEDAMVKEMLAKKCSNREQINSDHRLKYLFDVSSIFKNLIKNKWLPLNDLIAPKSRRYMECTKALIDSYEDKEGMRKEEINSMSGCNEFSEFYARLRNIKEYYKKHQNEISIPMSVEYEEFNRLRENSSDVNLVDFTDEEGYGKFLDLNDCFVKYLNLKGIEKIDYLTYLTVFDRLFEIPKDKKLNTEYRSYLESLLEYFEDYCARKETSSALTHSGAHLDLSAFSSWEELASLGLDRLKSALMALGLKCGGNLEERAKRLWSTKNKSLDEIDPSLYAKAKTGNMKSKQTEKQKEIAALEAQVYRFSELLSEQRQATKENVQRKQARTAGEREESDEEVSESESEEEQETEVIYNPKNLPLGWDGKPIPYWLYKLHGLNITYTCEICGNATYKGPKAFQRHFAEWRHAHGMRCLGIPNTAHFANVTHIEDALKLWQKLKEEKQKEKFQPANEEEYEDTEGRVVNKKTYEDLKRQGLL
ncbi:Splicing factor 3A subunit 3-like protein [Dinothrombium tinctorium]|uniref:Splicing factor 3A subunit 3-like protein n=1 Tax=Dinothrombium tinctorium TaxID=1965070 RepID=A0A3S4RJW6_9ACAR|nr:Splicing factor 3A subunit 3-like protein [Dinothrombium tinctorium]